MIATRRSSSTTRRGCWSRAISLAAPIRHRRDRRRWDLGNAADVDFFSYTNATFSPTTGFHGVSTQQPAGATTVIRAWLLDGFVDSVHKTDAGAIVF